MKALYNRWRYSRGLDGWRYRLTFYFDRLVWRLELATARVRFTARRFRRFVTRQPLAVIKITYEIVTPESAEHGEPESSGWVDDIGESMEPDPYDIADKKTRVDLALEFFSNLSYIEKNSSAFYPGVWYTEPEYGNGPRAYFERGEVETRAYHLYNFTDTEREQIFDGIGG